MALIVTQGFGDPGDASNTMLLPIMGYGAVEVFDFLGADFSLQSAVYDGAGTIRVRFTQDPLAVNPANVGDALNPDYYTLSGPNVNVVVGVGVVGGDPQSLDLFLAGPLASGVWTVTVNDLVQMIDLSSIIPPTSASLTVVARSIFRPLTGGAENRTGCEIVRSFLNPALIGPAWSAYCCALAAGDQINLDNADLAFDQLFTISASGLYLARKAADDGISRPKALGMTDRLFRQYAIKLATNQITELSLLDILEVFYGVEAIRAHVISDVGEPYNLNDGDVLSVLVDEQILANIVFSAPDFAVIGQATAIEVAAAITRGFREAGSNAYALKVFDPDTGENKVRIYSPSQGLGSALRVVGGIAQNKLLFPDLVDVYGVSLTPWGWDATFFPSSNRVRFQSTDNKVDLSLVQEGDYVNIYGDAVQADNRGTFTVVKVYDSWITGPRVQWFEVENDQGVTQAGISNMLATDIYFFRPTKVTATTASQRVVTVAQTGQNVDVVLPATSQAVNREEFTGAYLHTNPAQDIINLERVNGVVTVTSVNHGLSEHNQIIVDGVYGDVGTPPTTPGTILGNGGDSDTSIASVWSELAPTAVPGVVHGSAILMEDGRVLIAGGDDALSGGNTPTNACQLFEITALIEVNNTREATYAYTATDSLATPLTYSGISLGSNGPVLTGGYDGVDAVLDVFGYNPGTDLWVTLAVMIQARCAHTSTSISDGANILITGGCEPTPAVATNTCEIYDVAGDGWSFVASLNIARCEHQAVLLNDGKVLVVGGRSLASGGLFYATPTLAATGPVLASCEVYDPVLDTWTMTGPMSWARFQHQLVKLPDGRVLSIGGIGYKPSFPTATLSNIRDIEIWNPSTGRWKPISRTQVEHDSVIAAYLVDRNQVVIAGGSVSNYTELLDISTMTIVKGPGPLLDERHLAQAVVMANDVVLLVGGVDSGGLVIDDSFLYLANQDRVMAGGLNGVHRVDSVVDPNTFTYITNESAYTLLDPLADAVFTPMAATDSEIAGPFIFNPVDGVAVTKTETTIDMDLAKGHQYSSITVGDASAFPDAPGYLVMAFGYKNQVTPVPYLGRLSDTELLLDYGFRFPDNIEAGDSVILLKQRGPWVPDDATTVGSFYLTASASGRVAAQAAIEASVGAGIDLNIDIVYPGDRGLGNEGYPTEGSNKLSDVVEIFGGDDLEDELADAREGD